MGNAALYVSLGLSALAILGLPASAATAAVERSRDDSLDELVIESRRTKLTEMRDEMVRLEDRFYELYNAANEIDDFDIYCTRDTRAGTRLTARHCRAVYEIAAVNDESQEYIRFLQRNMPDANAASAQVPGQPKPPPPVVGGPPIPAIMMIEARRPEFRKAMAQVTRDHPELVRLLKEREKLEKRYHASRRRIFGLAGE
jgi:hypothetical protein